MLFRSSLSPPSSASTIASRIPDGVAIDVIIAEMHVMSGIGTFGVGGAMGPGNAANAGYQGSPGTVTWSAQYYTMDGFKVPQNIPQDLLLIQEFIGVPPPPPPNPQQEDEIDSSDSETVSEDEIAADLIKGTDEDNSTQIVEKTLCFSSILCFSLC